MSSITTLLVVTVLLLHRSFAEYNVETINIALKHPDHPVYDSRTGFLYFVDEDRLYCYNKAKGRYSWIETGGFIGPIVPTRSSSSKIIGGVENELVQITWDGKGPMKNMEVYSKVGTDNITRYNSGHADKFGRIWFATLNEQDGTPFDKEGSLRNITRDNKRNPSYYIINFWTKIRGFAFSKDNDIVYYVNPATHRVIKNNYHLNNATLSNPGISFDLLKQKGNDSADIELTGVVTDTDNNLWVSGSGGKVYHVDIINGNILKEVSIPAPYILNIGWGGKDMDILYVTAFTALKKETNKTNVGKLYAVTGLGAKGLKTFEANIS